MTGWGEVLEAMHLAPRGVRTVRLVVEQRRGTIPDPPPSTTDLDAGTTILMARSTARATVVLSSSGAASEDVAPWRTELWYEAGTGRFRLLRAGTTTLVDGTHRWVELGDDRVVRADVGAEPDQDLMLILLQNPEVLLGWFRYEDHDDATVLDRPAHWIRGTRRHTPVSGVLDFILPGDTADTIVDAETGVLLELQLRSGPTSTFSLHVTECGFDDFDPDELLTYQPPPGYRVLTPEQMHAELAAQHGPSGGGLPVPAERPPLTETSMPVGPPPDDPEAAREAIRYAVEHLTDIDDDRCPNIQGGANLAGCVRQTRQSPYVDEDEGANFECGEIAFVRPDEADVRFRVVVPRAPGGGIDTQGRALLIDGRWVVDRATACALFSMAGVTCPPPPPAD